MSEVRATQGAEIGAVLASIRRLIAQGDAEPDFSGPARRTDNSGRMRSTLPLGPRAEMLRLVIERELRAIEPAEVRLGSGADTRRGAVKPVGPDPAAGTAGRTMRTVTGHDVPARLVPVPACAAASPGSDGPAGNDPWQGAVSAREDQAFAADGHEDEHPFSGDRPLRELVRDMIRQELQGDGGDGISRNLRRAIRQEVAAAIAAGPRPV